MSASLPGGMFVAVQMLRPCWIRGGVWSTIGWRSRVGPRSCQDFDRAAERAVGRC